MDEPIKSLKNGYFMLETQLEQMRNSRLQEKLTCLKNENIIALKKINKEEEQLIKELKIAYVKWQKAKREDKQ